MNTDERIIGALKHEKTDRVPFVEWAIDKKVVEALMPGATADDLVYEMDLDAIPNVDLDFKKEMIGDKIKDEWGMMKQYTAEDHAFPLGGPIKDRDDFKAYKPPNPRDGYHYETLEKKLKQHQGKKTVIVHLNDVYSIPSRLMQYEDFLCTMAIDPGLIRDMVDMNVDIQLELAEECVKRGVKFVFTGDDVAYVNGPVMSPQMFEDIFLEPMKRVIGGFKDMGLYTLKHTDGDIMTLIDMILSTGIDCLDPIDPVAGMDLALIKEKYGKQVCIKGNVDCAQLLSFGTVEEVMEATKNCLRIGAPGGGYIISSSNSIHSSVRPENFKAMIDIIHKYRDYPLAENL